MNYEINQYFIDLGRFDDAVYFVTVQTNGFSNTARLILQHQ